LGFNDINFVDSNPGDLSLGGTWANKLSKHSVGPKNRYYKHGLVMGEPIGKSSVRESLIRKLFGNPESVLKSIYELIQEDIDVFDFYKNDALAMEYYAMHNRVRRAVPHVISDHVSFNRPFMDDEISESCLIVPIEIRNERQYQLKMMRYLDSKLSDLPSTSIKNVQKSKRLSDKIFQISKLIVKKIPLVSILGRKMLNVKIAKSTEDT
jgi:hypothetical protein